MIIKNKIILCSILFIILSSCSATGIGIYSKMELRSQNQVNYKFRTDGIFKENFKDRIFLDDGDYLYYFYLYNYTQAGIGLFGITPILPIPLVYLPWFRTRNCEIQKYGIIFYLTIINKNDLSNENFEYPLQKENIYLLNNNNQDKIFPIFLEKKTFNYTKSKVIDTDSNKILLFSENLKNTNGFEIKFNKPLNCLELKNYSLIIEKDNKIKLKIDIIYDSLSLEYYFSYSAL